MNAGHMDIIALRSAAELTSVNFPPVFSGAAFRAGIFVPVLGLTKVKMGAALALAPEVSV